MVKPLPLGTLLRCGEKAYEIQALIARGGTSFLYSAKQTGSNITRTIKEACPYDDQGLIRANFVIESKDFDSSLRLWQGKAAVLEEREIGQAIREQSSRTIPIWDVLVVDEISYAEECVQKGKTDTFGPGDSVFCILEHLDRQGKFLSQIINERRSAEKPFSIHEIALIIRNILEALTDVHGLRRDSDYYLHGDLSPGNIFFEDPKNSEVMPVGAAFLLDFGCSHEVFPNPSTGKTEPLEIVFTSRRFLAPEMRGIKPQLSQKVDIFAVGCILLELIDCLPGVFPEKRLYQLAGKSKFLTRGASPSISEAFYAFLRGCLEDDVDKRLSLSEALSAINTLCDETSAKYSIQAEPTATPYWVEHSRDEQIEQLEEALSKGTRPVFLFGEGGTGKTECAIQFLIREKQFGRKIAFIPFAGTMRDTIKSIFFSGYHGIPKSVPNADEEDYQRRLQLITEFNQNTLFVIDNFDRQDKSLEELQEEAEYHQFLSLPIDVLFTTRYIPDQKTAPLEPMAKEHLLQLFQNAAGLHDADLDASTKDAVFTLIELVDRNPLAAELMGSMVAASNGTLSIFNLLQEMKERKAFDDEALPKVRVRWNRSKKELRILDHLKALFDLSDLNGDQKRVMQYASLLPTGGIREGLFCECLNQSENIAYGGLKNRSWLKLRAGSLLMHPLIREVFIRETNRRYDDCTDFLDRLWERSPGKRVGYDHEDHRQMTAVFLNAHREFMAEDIEANSAFRAARIEWAYLERLHEAQALAEYVAETREKQGLYVEAAEAFRLLCNIVAETEVSTRTARMFAEHAYDLDTEYNSDLLQLESLAKDYRCLSISNTLHDQQAFLASKASILVAAAILYHAVPELRERLARAASELDDYLEANDVLNAFFKAETDAHSMRFDYLASSSLWQPYLCGERGEEYKFDDFYKSPNERNNQGVRETEADQIPFSLGLFLKMLEYCAVDKSIGAAKEPAILFLDAMNNYVSGERQYTKLSLEEEKEIYLHLILAYGAVDPNESTAVTKFNLGFTWARIADQAKNEKQRRDALDACKYWAKQALSEAESTSADKKIYPLLLLGHVSLVLWDLSHDPEEADRQKGEARQYALQAIDCSRDLPREPSWLRILILELEDKGVQLPNRKTAFRQDIELSEELFDGTDEARTWYRTRREKLDHQKRYSKLRGYLANLSVWRIKEKIDYEKQHKTSDGALIDRIQMKKEEDEAWVDAQMKRLEEVPVPVLLLPYHITSYNGIRIKQNVIRCKFCGDVIESSEAYATHKIQICSCGQCGIDGGHFALIRFTRTPDQNYFEELSIIE